MERHVRTSAAFGDARSSLATAYDWYDECKRIGLVFVMIFAQPFHRRVSSSFALKHSVIVRTRPKNYIQRKTGKSLFWSDLVKKPAKIFQRETATNWVNYLVNVADHRWLQMARDRNSWSNREAYDQQCPANHKL
ncbi:hypothetical protein EVAR_15679_1 [Eumeta japonica]|uniref:Uncharacterized protein n=1 Tax=Eumeta variegata TaxID=151549 RepID=A0A4C1U9C6_EUMVA|nr:hypothetical protein EVAR_15679_1 [Eumeta japonica]